MNSDSAVTSRIGGGRRKNSSSLIRQVSHKGAVAVIGSDQHAGGRIFTVSQSLGGTFSAPGASKCDLCLVDCTISTCGFVVGTTHPPGNGQFPQNRSLIAVRTTPLSDALPNSI